MTRRANQVPAYSQNQKIVKSCREKYLSSVFRKIVMVYAAARLAKRDVTANRHET
jgi:hypothetical protein